MKHTSKDKREFLSNPHGNVNNGELSFRYIKTDGIAQKEPYSNGQFRHHVTSKKN